MASVQRGRLDELERSSEGEDDEHFVGETGSGETIARLGLTHSHSDTLSFNAALEGAYNFLDGDSRLRENGVRSEEHTSELQSLMSISYAVFCLKKKTQT